MTGRESTADGRRVEDAVGLHYTVVRSVRRKRTMQLSVGPGLEVIVRTPVGTSDAEIRAFVLGRRDWLVTQQQKMAEAAPARKLVSGAHLPYLGESLILAVELRFCRAASMVLDGDTLRVTLPLRLDEGARDAALSRSLGQWYARRATETIGDLVRVWTPFAGKLPSRVLIRDQKRRWGSCAPDGSLRFNWHLAMADRELIEYVVVHELAHLTHRNHAAAFWAEVERALPDYKARRKSLRLATPSLTL
jgi:predicted metal-dependent hydrolase